MTNAVVVLVRVVRHPHAIPNEALGLDSNESRLPRYSSPMMHR